MRGGFVQDLYACDTVPFKHLVNKTRYLLKLKPNIIFILVENAHPDPQIVGSGAFKHEQCMVIKGVKTEIRNRFNPKRTENHVVHASDYESQTRHVLRILDIRVPKKWGGGRIKTVRLDSLRANIIGSGLVSIEDTPHYKFVCGRRALYQKYYDKYFGTRLTDDHAPQAFDLLIKNFKYSEPIVVSGNKVLDGVHRLAILKKRGVDEVSVRDVGIHV